ncbi:hypothetical protein Q0P64_13840, partial [Staphylococcus aureus]|nr:hypothetical protein [Staphylococcus aureus]
RGLGVKGGLGISSFLPLFFPVTYLYLLPKWSELAVENAYRPVAADDEAEPEPEPVPDENDGVLAKPVPKVWLSTRDKINLIKPL